MSLASPDPSADADATPSSYFETYPRKKSRKPPPPASRRRPPSPDVDPPIDPRTPPLRHSGSSSATHYLDTPPRTPPPVINFSLVSAPIPDVGTMDALVDGMNAFDRDDIFYASSLHRHQQSISASAKSSSPHHSEFPPASRPSSSSKPAKQPSPVPPPSRIPRPRQKRPASGSNSHVFPTKQPSLLPSRRATLEQPVPPSISAPSKPPSPTKVAIPSIHDIIRAHATALASSKPPSSLDSRDSLDIVSRSSIDTIAEEVQHTLRQPIPEARSPGGLDATPSILHKPQQVDPDRFSIPASDANSSLLQSEAIATYIRSARLTTLIKLPRPLRAPLQVSLSDLGDPNGRPLLVFLGLGAVRYLMGLYDEMAEILGLRIITIDRWGLGRTTQDPPNLMGVKEWARVVNDVLDRMGIDHCSILAHSAGAPYAMSFANQSPHRIKGDICLLAPWVGGGENGYKWLKYIPNSILKTAHAAEWRLQTWMLGKPPSMNYQGIGYDKWNSVDQSTATREVSSYFDTQTPSRHREPTKSNSVKSDRSSILSNDYDDLADFEGCFESRSTLTTIPPSPVTPSGWSPEMGSRKRRSSRGFFQAFLPRSSGIRRDSTASSTRPSLSNVSLSSTKAPKLKNLRSIGSLRGSSKSIIVPSLQNGVDIPTLPPIGLGLGGLEWPKLDQSTPSPLVPVIEPGTVPHARTRRSISLTTQSSACKTPQLQRHNKSQPDVNSNGRADRPEGTIGYQASLANALIAASHAEASKGVHSDLLQILNHEGRPWGFSYTSYPHNLRVWYGDKDERIAEGAVRWMERTMGSERCEVKVIKNADHSLMYRSAVIVEVLEIVRSFWS